MPSLRTPCMRRGARTLVSYIQKTDGTSASSQADGQIQPFLCSQYKRCCLQQITQKQCSQQWLDNATGIGGAPPPKKDLHRLVKWPRYVRIQRQRRVLGQRLKVPPALTRFTKTLDKSTAATLFKLLLKYRPEARKEKKERLLKEAESREAGQKVRTSQKCHVILDCSCTKQHSCSCLRHVLHGAAVCFSVIVSAACFEVFIALLRS